jgi:D-serine deaminase-like pyridoxal phosphate-dependent protein
LPLSLALCHLSSPLIEDLARMSLTIAELETPVPVVDLDRLAHNLDRAAAYATAHHLALRPHIKTHKSPRIASEQLRRGAVGLTCATPFEAEVMSGVCDDILVAYPPVGPARANRLAALPETVKLTVALDSLEAIDMLAAAARDADRSIGVYVELDVGMHRVGVPAFDDAIALARAVVARAPLVFEGIAFYPGHIREAVGRQTQKLEELSTSLGAALQAFDRAGLPPAVVSGGSTPTLWNTHEIVGVTEFRPGTYVYNDRTTAAVGACTWDECAFTVLATVVSTAVPGQAVIDAGTKSLGREPMRGAEGEGFGCVLGRTDVVVKSMSEEHGMLDLSNTSWRPAVGERVRIIPNHVCIVVHLNDVIAGIRGDVVETTWDVEARGRGYAIQA